MYSVSFYSSRNVASTLFFFFSSRRRHTRFDCDWSSDVCSSDLAQARRGLGFTAWRDYRRFSDLEDTAYGLLETVLLEGKWRAAAGALAHGEKRKLELGILLALEPEVLLLDEPTAGMSLEEVPAIIELIERIRAGRDRTILLVEHKIDMVMALSDSIAVLLNGRLLADGPPAAVSASAEVQAAYFGTSPHPALSPEGRG